MISRCAAAVLIPLAFATAAMADTGDDSHLDPPASGRAKSRTFDFVYGAAVKQLPEGSRVRVWIPIPPSNERQQVKRTDQSLPSGATIGTEATYGNKILYFELRAPASGKFDFSTTYRIKRMEVLGAESKVGSALTESQRKLFLAANAKVPIDGKPAALIQGLDLPQGDTLRLGQMLYDKVDEHMKYDKSKPGYGQGDAVWACNSRTGNCTDFHSLFISMSRSQGLPARFEIGFPLPEKRGQGRVGGYHCWAFFHVDGKGWVPVDISEADKHPQLKQYYFGNLTENRVTFSTGRDLTLVPRQQSEPLNYFVYPHVEVDRKPWPREKMEQRFKFKDVR